MGNQKKANIQEIQQHRMLSCNYVFIFKKMLEHTLFDLFLGQTMSNQNFQGAAVQERLESKPVNDLVLEGA